MGHAPHPDPTISSRQPLLYHVESEARKDFGMNFAGTGGHQRHQHTTEPATCTHNTQKPRDTRAPQHATTRRRSRVNANGKARTLMHTHSHRQCNTTTGQTRQDYQTKYTNTPRSTRRSTWTVSVPRSARLSSDGTVFRSLPFQLFAEATAHACPRSGL